MVLALVYDDGNTAVALFSLDEETRDYWRGVCSFNEHIHIRDWDEPLPQKHHDGEYELVYVTERGSGEDTVQNLCVIPEAERSSWETRVTDCAHLRVQEYPAIDYSEK